MSRYEPLVLHHKRCYNGAMHGRQQTATAASIFALAAQHNIVYEPTKSDVWAGHVTRLAGDDVELDAVELLLLQLQRAGLLSRPEALQLQVNYLREAKLYNV